MKPWHNARPEDDKEVWKPIHGICVGSEDWTEKNKTVMLQRQAEKEHETLYAFMNILKDAFLRT